MYTLTTFTCRYVYFVITMAFEEDLLGPEAITVGQEGIYACQLYSIESLLVINQDISFVHRIMGWMCNEN